MIVLSAAMTLDGKIGQRNKKVVLSSKSDKIRVHKLRSKFDAILVGKNTVEQDNPLLTVRHVKGIIRQFNWQCISIYARG